VVSFLLYVLPFPFLQFLPYTASLPLSYTTLFSHSRLAPLLPLYPFAPLSRSPFSFSLFYCTTPPPRASLSTVSQPCNPFLQCGEAWTR
jgi:hypothetical protein